MPNLPESAIKQALAWAAATLGPVTVLSDRSKEHGGHVSATTRIAAPVGACYLKIHDSPVHWHNEVHAYEQWATVFGDLAPRLLAVRDDEPLALVVSEVPGQVVEGLALPPAQEQAIWRSAGAALVALHHLEPGAGFGPCLRDGTPAEVQPPDAVAYVGQRFTTAIERAVQGHYITADELTTLQVATDLIPAFAHERPVPCHRDYCAANWLVSATGVLTGVIDFEFAHWDVRMADFSRDPDWHWIHRPDLMDAFFAGYGHPLTAVETRQLLVARAEYALSAITWGRYNAFYGFEQEGRAALVHLAGLLG